MDGTPIFETLDDAKAYVQSKRDEGVICPCCARYVRVYKRKLNRGMATAFYQFMRLFAAKNEPVHVREFYEPSGRRDFSQLRFWGLCHELPKDEEQHGRTSGLWRPTPLGVEFAAGRTRVPAYRIHVSGADGETLGWSAETVSLSEALPRGFDYDELMDEDPSLVQIPPWLYAGALAHATMTC